MKFEKYYIFVVINFKHQTNHLNLYVLSYVNNLMEIKLYNEIKCKQIKNYQVSIDSFYFVKEMGFISKITFRIKFDLDIRLFLREANADLLKKIVSMFERYCILFVIKELCRVLGYMMKFCIICLML
jgi:hypothetical protein